MPAIIEYEFGISAIDSEFRGPLMDAVHLIVENGRAALVDTASNECVPRVMEALRKKGLTSEDVDYVILTHIHLDHAGGAGLLMRELPNARLAVHPRGARHMADPSRLFAGTVAVYGERRARRMYGEILPVDPGRIIETPHESTVKLAGRELVFLDTPGHARHHVCIVDGASGHIFAGDTFGTSYRAFDRDGRQFVFPITTPVQFDPDELHRSVDLLLSLRPEAIYVTHFGQVSGVPRLGGDLHRLIDAHADLALREKDSGEQRQARLVEGVKTILLGEAQRHQWPIARQRLLDMLRVDIELNAQGLASWLDS